MIKLPAVFSDHMVLQRNRNIKVWGRADSEKITVSLGETSVSTTVREGEWSLELPPMPAGGPFSMQVTDGTETVCYQDIMLGEVWLAGGQSNMELELQNSKNGAEIVKNISNDAVRFYYTPKVPWVGDKLYEAEEESSWELCTPETAGRWSAVGYYFADKLSEDLDVTVGVIGCNWGGTSASCWVGREALEQEKRISSYIEEYDEIVKDQDFDEYVKAREAYLIYQAEFDKNVGHYYETAKNPTWDEALRLYGENQYPGPMGPRSETRPCGLYESMLQRVCPYTLAGFLYYQGEEDDHKPAVYDTLLQALVRQWRKDWKDESLPFMVVQLPMFQNGGEPDYKNWPLIREAQMRLYQNVKNTGIAVILDQGEYGNIHPTEKKIVGDRLALQALYHVYHSDVKEQAFGPIYRSYRREGERMYLSFEHAEHGICCTEDVIEGFEIAGADRKYYPADAELVENEICVTSDQVREPLSVRFCWTNYAPVTLFGKNGIPVAPFRTDLEDGAVATGSRQG